MQSLKQFKLVAFLEGLSYLALLFIAMPLKYMADMPMAVHITGSVHGLLFCAFVLLLFRVATEHDWSIKRSAWAFIASLVPFGTFVLDRELKRELETVEQLA